MMINNPTVAWWLIITLVWGVSGILWLHLYIEKTKKNPITVLDNILAFQWWCIFIGGPFWWIVLVFNLLGRIKWNKFKLDILLPKTRK